MKVLIVDDEPQIAELICEVIEKNFMCGADLAENGLDAFILCQENKYQLIVTDHKMPFMTGAALITAVRTRKNASKKTPILMLSAFVTDGLKEELLKKEITKVEFLLKPFREEDLIEKIRPLLN